ncbi:hypothetical protein MTO96_034173 [Rhipicephalus appendiculatus]
MYSAIPPPPFLQCPGVPPIPWKKWRRVLQVYIDAAAPDATPERKKVLLLNALGVEGLHTYYKAADEQTQLDGDQATGDGAARDAYQQALAVLDAYFAPPEEALCVRAQFRRRVQQPDETAVQFMQALRRLADNCNFGTAAATMLHGQIPHGLLRTASDFHTDGRRSGRGARRPRVAAADCSASGLCYATRAWTPRRSPSSTYTATTCTQPYCAVGPAECLLPLRFASALGEFSVVSCALPYLQQLLQARTPSARCAAQREPRWRFRTVMQVKSVLPCTQSQF